MSLHSPVEHENQRTSRHSVFLSSRHSRARWNPGLFPPRRISLDTRPRFRGGMLSNRGYDET